MPNTGIISSVLTTKPENQPDLVMEISLSISSLVAATSMMLMQRRYFHVGPMKLKSFHDLCVGLVGTLRMTRAEEPQAMAENIEQMIIAAQLGEDGVTDIGGNGYEFIFSPNPMYREGAIRQYTWKLSVKTIRTEPPAPAAA